MFTKSHVFDLTRGMLVTFDVAEHDAGEVDDVAWHYVDHIDVSNNHYAVIGLRSVQGSFSAWTDRIAYRDECVTRDDFDNFDV